jgi:hypothetical protein
MQAGKWLFPDSPVPSVPRSTRRPRKTYAIRKSLMRYGSCYNRDASSAGFLLIKIKAIR